MENATSRFYNSDQVTKCSLQCPVECNSIRFSHTISLAEYPSKWLAVQSESHGLEPSERLIVNVFYNEMFYSLIEDSPAITVDSLLALIGGSLGLFLGASFLTLLEAVEFTYYTCFYCFVRRRRNPYKHRSKFPIKSDDKDLMIFV